MPAIFSFDLTEVEKLMDHAEAATDWSMGYEIPGEPSVEKGPALLLVGDDGVYLMSKGVPGLYSEEGAPKMFVVYAEGLNPHKEDTGEVYDRKRSMFGGDDGVEVLPWIAAIREMRKRQPDRQQMQIIVAQDSFELLIPKSADLMP